MAEGEHAHGEQFPRAETAELVGEALAAENRRWRIQVALVSTGVTALVLGLPTASLFGFRMLQVWPTARGEWTGLHLVPSLLARGLTAITGWRADQAWYFVSALAAGCTAAVLLGIARRRGAGPLCAIFSTLMAMTIPVAWIAATVPGAASCGLLGAAWLFGALDAEKSAPSVRRSTIAWIGAALLHAWNLYLWPAYVIALTSRRRAHVGLALGALAAWTAIVAGAWSLEHGTERLRAFVSAAWRPMLAGGSGGWGPLAAWSFAWVAGLGVGALGVARVVHAWMRDPERRPPAWMLFFALFPLAVLGVGGVITFDVPWLWLVPIAFLGFVEGAFLPSWALVVLALAGIVLVRSFSGVRADDDWHNRAVLRLRPTDLVLAASPGHADVLRVDLGLDVVDVAEGLERSSGNEAVWAEAYERAARARAERRRVVIDVRDVDPNGAWVPLDAPELAKLRDLGAIDL